MWVVKLGGSLARNGRLRPWIEALTGQDRSERPPLVPNLVIVPGGGPFADRVREMQATLEFDEPTAHGMAVLAMEQYGLMLAGLCPGLVPVSSKAALLKACQNGDIPLWMPSRMVIGRGDIPALWEVTSDSLAAWLAGHLKATCLILVKSVDPLADDPVSDTRQQEEQPTVTLSALQERGVIDRAFGKFVSGDGVDVRCLGPADLAGFVAALEGGTAPGVKVELTG
ncbi:MAG: hypothetical protein ISR48_07270 [Alphaproteobacteria bacterium]|nr:hypothetical protein [Alphaproteobacteria bacterium]